MSNSFSSLPNNNRWNNSLIDRNSFFYTASQKAKLCRTAAEILFLPVPGDIYRKQNSGLFRGLLRMKIDERYGEVGMQKCQVIF